ncbi:MAG: response regulator transcription factor [Verrucomicrobia bacterium]|nr:response regulator transcription factor [Verrucomicrobiota bacterium]
MIKPSETCNSTRVFIVDDHPLVREWLTNLINQQTGLAVAGEADNPAAALEAIAATKPDIAVIDLSLGNRSGLELIKDLAVRHPSLATVVLSMHEEALYAERALRAGARGYVMKSETSKSIVTCIRRVLSDEIYVSEAVATKLATKYLQRQKQAAVSPVELLSDRELEVFRLLGQGRGTSEIAETLHLSPKTVQAYCARVKEKLGVNTFGELVREAVQFEGSAL